MTVPLAPHSFVEGEYRFHFEPGYAVCRFECSDFYSHQAQNFCNSCKEMDFVLYHPIKRELWLVEVKDYRFNARPRIKELNEKLCRKVRDTLFLLRMAAICAPEEHPQEGISLREMALMSLQAKTIRLAFTIELGATWMHPTNNLLVLIKDTLYRQLKFIDAQMLCLPITQSGAWCPWRISAAGHEHSSRIQKRIEEAQVQHVRKQARKKARKAEAEAAAKAAPKPTPLWKRRAEKRSNEYARRNSKGSRADAAEEQ